MFSNVKLFTQPLGFCIVMSRDEVFFRDFMELLRPLFTGPLAQQPRYVADTGGDDQHDKMLREAPGPR